MKKKVLVLGCNFAGLTAARFIHKETKGAVDITVIDRKNYVNFIPNIPIEVFANRNPEDTMEFPFQHHLKSDGTEFILGNVEALDIGNKRVIYTPSERAGAAQENISYDFLVISLGCKLTYDKIEGFSEFGHTFTDTYQGNKTRRYLHKEYKGGPIAVGSDRFIQGQSPKLPDIPQALAACEGPPVEITFSIGDWLTRHKKGGPENVTVFTPAEVIADDAGKRILDQLLPIVSNMGFGYVNNTVGIKRLHKDGIEFLNGKSLEAELKIILPNWEPHDFMKGLPISDDQGFVITDWYMQNPDYPEIFSCGDAASVTVPKLGSLGHSEAEVVAKMIAKEVLSDYHHEIKPVQPQVLCFGDMGHGKGFYMHTNEWWGGDTSVLQMGYMPYMLKMGFKVSYELLGGNVPSWGVPVSIFAGDHIAI
ncbi:MAG: FAD-dependent oxidoreductase [Coriobacteriales bacterium]|jgi:sulfide:quinone oxidoreductase|nr:FAD-dependent oxidoreductase [Coriobacteriales bacterium]